MLWIWKERSLLCIQPLVAIPFKVPEGVTKVTLVTIGGGGGSAVYGYDYESSSGEGSGGEGS